MEAMAHAAVPTADGQTVSPTGVDATQPPATPLAEPPMRQPARFLRVPERPLRAAAPCPQALRHPYRPPPKQEATNPRPDFKRQKAQRRKRPGAPPSHPRPGHNASAR
jgi:hypothetical protein